MHDFFEYGMHGKRGVQGKQTWLVLFSHVLAQYSSMPGLRMLDWSSRTPEAEERTDAKSDKA